MKLQFLLFVALFWAFFWCARARKDVRSGRCIPPTFQPWGDQASAFVCAYTFNRAIATRSWPTEMTLFAFALVGGGLVAPSRIPLGPAEVEAGLPKFFLTWFVRYLDISLKTGLLVLFFVAASHLLPAGCLYTYAPLFVGESSLPLEFAFTASTFTAYRGLIFGEAMSTRPDGTRSHLRFFAWLTFATAISGLVLVVLRTASGEVPTNFKDYLNPYSNVGFLKATIFGAGFSLVFNYVRAMHYKAPGGRALDIPLTASVEVTCTGPQASPTHSQQPNDSLDNRPRDPQLDYVDGLGWIARPGTGNNLVDCAFCDGSSADTLRISVWSQILSAPPRRE